MKRAAVRVLAIVIVLGLLASPVLVSLTTDDATSGPDPVTVTAYDASFRVLDDGSVQATERLTTEFPTGRHGLFRFWDLRDPSDSHVRLEPRDIEVTLDGEDEPFELSWEKARRYRVAKIGDPDITLEAGEHVYTISYRVKGALSPATAGAGTYPTTSGTDTQPAESVFFWNVVAPGWGLAMDRTRTTIELPVDAGRIQCTVGDTGSCEVDGSGTRQVTVETGALEPRTPVTVRVGLATPTQERTTLPWPVALDPVLGRHVPLLTLSILIALAAFVGALVVERRSREDAPGFGVAYEPPAGLGPVQAAYVMTERVPDQALVATLLYQAEQGLTTLRHDDDRWTVTGQGDDAAWAATDEITRYVGTELGVTRAGATFIASPTGVEAGEVLEATKSGLAVETRAWAETAGAEEDVTGEKAARNTVWACVALTAVVAIFTSATVYALPFAAVVLGGVGLLGRGVGRRRTPVGRDLWSRAGGFHRLLSTDSARSRFDFSGRQDVYTSFIPFAVAFDCADTWARKYQNSTGAAAPLPLWYGTGTGSGISTSAEAVSSFQSSLSSSISAYAATQSSSSSGGGGGFGGGGGGGGGGGSW